MDFIATTAYGTEGLLAQELKDLGIQTDLVQTSRVAFSGDVFDAARANICLRTAGRVRFVIGQFPASSFDELFDNTAKLPWADYLSPDAAFPVTARCVSSTLMSVPDCQRIVKRAIVASLQKRWNRNRFPETGLAFPVEVHIWKDEAVLSIDTSGEPLHRRGYRKLNGPAALRETLAASLVLLSHWHADRSLIDPCCGTGTIAIEAAMIGRKLAPGLHRAFAAEAYPWWSGSSWEKARQYARDMEDPTRPLDIIAGDIDPEAVSMASYHANRAGVFDAVDIRIADAFSTEYPTQYGHLITNPPYGERMSSQKESRLLYKELGRQWKAARTWSTHIITSDPDFETAFGFRASKRRVLFNGPLQCRFYQYFGARPPKGYKVNPD